eukprot:CAMPEP_0185002906 /NCGR_PEP_ID=MMETSP1098-20130426/75135_1 /TAXON_ID=89044 /ORGANISM="Spumella elongata, Strain CCAP 955/1" /LENGTH=55 /DNA_ID=CAMNT_0027530489 /DNA_START=13 /DNA_END=177 /DNA_ORIENTATION=+
MISGQVGRYLNTICVVLLGLGLDEVRRCLSVNPITVRGCTSSCRSVDNDCDADSV